MDRRIIGHVLRRGLADDPDQAFDAADTLFPTLRELNPEFAADSAFGPVTPRLADARFQVP